ILAALNPFDGEYPLPNVSGSGGTGKTTLARRIKRIVDPTSAATRKLSTEENLFTAAQDSHLLLFDNQSYITHDQSDALCRLLSGSAFSDRKFYFQGVEIVLQARRPVLLTSIEDIGTRDDLLDRSILVKCKDMADDDKEKVAVLNAAFEEALPRIL